MRSGTPAKQTVRTTRPATKQDRKAYLKISSGMEDYFSSLLKLIEIPDQLDLSMRVSM